MSSRNREMASRFKLSPSRGLPNPPPPPPSHPMTSPLNVAERPSFPSKRSISAERQRGHNPSSSSSSSSWSTNSNSDRGSKLSKKSSPETSALNAPRRSISASTKLPWPSTRPFSGAAARSCDLSALSASSGRPRSIGNSESSCAKPQSRYAPTDQALKPSANVVVPGLYNPRKVAPEESKRIPRLSRSRDCSENSLPQENVRLLDHPHHGLEAGGVRDSVKKPSLLDHHHDGVQGGRSRDSVKKPSRNRNSNSSSSTVIRLSSAGAMGRSMDLTSTREKPFNNASSASVRSRASPRRECLPRMLSSSRPWQPASLNEGPIVLAKSSSDNRRKSYFNETETTASMKLRPASGSTSTGSRGRTQDHVEKVSNECSKRSQDHVEKSSNGCCRDLLHHVKLSAKDPHSSEKTMGLSCYGIRTLDDDPLSIESGSAGEATITNNTSSASGLCAVGNTVGIRVGDMIVSTCYLQETMAGRVPPRLMTSGSPLRSSSSVLLSASMSSSSSSSSSSSPWSVISNHSFSGFLASQQPQSPARSSSLYRSIPSPSKSVVISTPQMVQPVSRASNTSTLLRFGADVRKGKKGAGQVDETHLHSILHNRLIQWRLVNARAKAITKAQNFMAAKSLYNVYMRIFDLRSSVAKKAAKLHQARHARRLNAILSAQSPMLEDWVNIQNEHTSALKGIMEALEAAVLQVPVTAGVKANTHVIKTAMTSAFDALNSIEESVTYLLPKVEKTKSLVCELGLVATQEKALLEECVSLLAMISSLEIEERSIRAYIIQCEHEKICVLGRLMDTPASIL